MFKKGQKVVKIFKIGGTETATLCTIAKAGKSWVQCEEDSHLKYDVQTGRELDPAPAFGGVASSRLVEIEE